MQPLHPPHWQFDWQYRSWYPQLPHDDVCRSPGEHDPVPRHAPQASHPHAELQVRYCVPHRPHAWLPVAPRTQAKVSSGAPLQLSSAPLQTSDGAAGHAVTHIDSTAQLDQLVHCFGAMAEHAPHTPPEHDCVPLPHAVEHPWDWPSVTPLQSSSRLLHASAAPGFTKASPSLQSPPRTAVYFSRGEHRHFEFALEP
jgi:hypothetical protein